MNLKKNFQNKQNKIYKLKLFLILKSQKKNENLQIKKVLKLNTA